MKLISSAALTDAKQFDGVAKLSAAMKAMSGSSTPSAISAVAGGTFALFGGYITGRQIELVPNARIVQVWRDDEGALNRTMAEIDKRLKQMRERLGRIGAGF